MIDDLGKLKADMQEFRCWTLAAANIHPDSAIKASCALDQVRGPLVPAVAAKAAFIAERAVALAEGIAAVSSFGEITRLRDALQRIAALDPAKDSEDGHNEWGEADCFSQAQAISARALGRE